MLLWVAPIPAPLLVVAPTLYLVMVLLEPFKVTLLILLLSVETLASLMPLCLQVLKQLAFSHP